MIVMRGGKRTAGLIELIESIPEHKRGTIVEVGSWAGESTQIFARYFRQVLTVDSWHIHLPFEKYQCTIEDVFDKYREAVSGCDNVAWLRMLSVDAARLMPEKSFDMAYVDAQHIYPQMRADTTAWVPKVKTGGYYCGHDYSMDGVTRVVQETFGTPDAVFQDDSFLVQVR